MLGLIVGSYLLEKILPLGLKERLGTATCWAMIRSSTRLAFASSKTVGYGPHFLELGSKTSTW